MIQVLIGLLWVVLWALFHWHLVPPDGWFVRPCASGGL
jgi:hypothetical protein